MLDGSHSITQLEKSVTSLKFADESPTPLPLHNECSLTQIIAL